MAIAGITGNRRIYLKAGSKEYNQEVSKVSYGWEKVYAPGQQDYFGLDGQIDSNHIGVRRIIKLIIFDLESRENINTEFILNTFAPSLTQKYKESNWTDYLDVEIANNGDFPLFQDIQNISQFEITLRSKKTIAAANIDLEYVDKDYTDGSYSQ